MTRRGALGRWTAGLAVLVAASLALPASAAFAGVSIDIKAPQGPYELGQSVTADYTCTSPFTVTQCALFDSHGALAPGAPVDTSTVGDHLVSVAVVDTQPSDGVFQYFYSVVAAEPPAVTLTTPADGARYSALRTLLAPVRVSYSCSDALSGIASCKGTQPSGARLDTGFTALGRHSFKVTARDKAGNTTTVVHSYTVTL